jgi:3alpha(or 20beta)-hydroxysteroid dehydrogenase
MTGDARPKHRRNVENVNRDPAGALQSKVILITGGSGGIGLAIAQTCRQQGARVVLAARDARRLRRSAALLGGDAITVAADLGQAAGVRRLMQTVAHRCKRLDAVVHSAGIFTYKPFVRTTLRDWNLNLSSNLTSLFLVMQGALPLLKQAAAPQLVSILSVSSRRAFPKCAAYCASKFGALGHTRVLAEELRGEGIRVSAILPGSTDTRMMSEFDFPVIREKLMQPEDVAAAVLLALSAPLRSNVDEVLITPSAGRL